MPIVMLLDLFILVLGGSGGTIGNVPQFSDTLFPMVLHAGSLESCGHDHGVRDWANTKIFWLVLVCFTSI